MPLPDERSATGARELHTLAEIVQQINQSLELERVFALVARHAADLVGARGARVATIDGERVVVQASFGVRPVPTGTALPLHEVLVGRAVREAQPVRTDDLRDLASPAAAGDERVNAVAVPLLVGGRAIGGILAFGNAARAFDDRDAQVLLTLANHAAIAIENARLYRSAARTARHASILAETARALAQQVTPQSLYEEIGRIATRSLGAAGVALYLADPTTRFVELALARGISGVVLDPFLRHFWELPAGRVVTTGEPVFSSDVEALLAEYDAETVSQSHRVGLRSLALLPIFVEGRPHGMLSIRYTRRHEFDDDERMLLVDFASQVAVAMRNARLFADLERRAARIAAVATVQQAISASVALDAVYREIYRAVASVVDAPCFTFLGTSEDGAALVVQYLVIDGIETPLAVPAPRIPFVDSSLGQTFTTRVPRVAARPLRWWEDTPYDQRADPRVEAELVVPVAFGPRTLGVIQVLSYDAGAYTFDDVDLVALLARQAGLAIENARLFDAQRRERELAEAGGAIARAALEGTSTRRVARRLVGVLTEVVGCDGIALAVVDDGAMHYVAFTGMAPGHPGLRVPLEESGTQAVLRSGRPAAVKDLRAAAAPSFAHLVPSVPGFVVPMVANQRIIGVVIAMGGASGAPTSAQRATLQRLAAPTALALDAVRLAERERERHERERTLAAALATMEQPVFVLALDSRIRYANAAAVREYGYALEELTSMHVSELIASARPAGADDASGTPVPAAAALAPGGMPMWTAEHVHRRKDGREFPAAVAMSRILDESGMPIGHVLTARNLTDERRIAEQLRQTEKLAALGELVAGVAHELNNPLTGISAFAQLLLEDRLEGEQQESVRLIQKEADRAVGVIRDLLLFSRKSGPRRVPVDLNALLQQTLRLRAYGLRTAGIAIVTELDPHLPPLEADDQKLQQLFLNLVVNAEHAMQSSPRRELAIRTRSAASPVGAPPRVVVEVEDTGVGMPPHVAEHVFEPFFTTKPAGEGTGLGLSVSYGIVQTHGGEIEVESEPEVGTRFTVTLPASPSPAAQ